MISSEFKTHSCQHQNLPILQTFLNAILLAPGPRLCLLTGVEGVEPVSQVRCWGALGTSIGISLPWTHVQQYQRQSAWLVGLKCFFGQLPRTTWNRARLCKCLIVNSFHISRWWLDKWFREDMEVHPTIFSETISLQMFAKVITCCSLCQHRWFRINNLYDA